MARRIPLRSPSSLLYRTVAALIRGALRLVTRKDWHGQDDMPAEGGFIAVSNHVTYADPLTLAHFLYNSGYPPHFLGKSTLFSVPFIGMILRKTDQIPVHRGTVHAKDAVDTGMKVLRAGDVIRIFPEGTLTRDPDLWPMVARTGAARMALETGVPVIPVAQWGAHKLLGHYSKRLHPFPRKVVTIKAGPPVDLDDLREKPIDNEKLREASKRIIDTLTAMVEEMRGETAPTERYDMRKHKA